MVYLSGGVSRFAPGTYTNRAASTGGSSGGGVAMSAPLMGGVSVAPKVPPAIVAPVQNTNPVQVTTVTNDPTYNQPLYYTETNNIESPFKGMSLRGNAPSMDIPSFNFSPLNPLTDPSMGVLPSAHQASLIQNVGGGGSNDNFMKAFALAEGGQILPPQVAPPIQQQRRTQDPDGLQAQTPSMDVPPVAPQRQQAPPPYMPPPQPQRIPVPQPVAPMPFPAMAYQNQLQNAIAPNRPYYPVAPNFRDYLPQPAPPKQGLAGLYDRFVHQPAQRLAEATNPNVAYAHAHRGKGDSELRAKMYEVDNQNYRNEYNTGADMEKAHLGAIKDLALEEMRGNTDLQKAHLSAQAQGRMNQAQGWNLFSDAMNLQLRSPSDVARQAQMLQAASDATGHDFSGFFGKMDSKVSNEALKEANARMKEALEIQQKKYDLGAGRQFEEQAANDRHRTAMSEAVIAADKAKPENIASARDFQNIEKQYMQWKMRGTDDDLAALKKEHDRLVNEKLKKDIDRPIPVDRATAIMDRLGIGKTAPVSTTGSAATRSNRPGAAEAATTADAAKQAWLAEFNRRFGK